MPTYRDHTFSLVVWAWPRAAGLKEGTGKMRCVLSRGLAVTQHDRKEGSEGLVGADGARDEITDTKHRPLPVSVFPKLLSSPLLSPSPAQASSSTILCKGGERRGDFFHCSLRPGPSKNVRASLQDYVRGSSSPRVPPKWGGEMPL